MGLQGVEWGFFIKIGEEVGTKTEKKKKKRFNLKTRELWSNNSLQKTCFSRIPISAKKISTTNVPENSQKTNEHFAIETLEVILKRVITINERQMTIQNSLEAFIFTLKMNIEKGKKKTFTSSDKTRGEKWLI